MMNAKLKVLKKALNKISDDRSFFNALMGRYLRDIHDPVIKPKGKKNYLGIEIECFATLDEAEVMALLLEHDLEKYVDIGEDGSIETDNDELEYELRVLVAENELAPVMKKLGKFLKKGKFKVNESCGLHVHLDMRNRDVDKCYDKLMKFQDILFGMVNQDRWYSDYCKYSSPYTRFERFSAINRTSFDKHKTLEVRLHEGSVDVKKIQNWIWLLLKGISYNVAPQVKSKADVLSLFKKDKKISSYIGKNFKDVWFKRRKHIVTDSYNDDNGLDE